MRISAHFLSGRAARVSRWRWGRINPQRSTQHSCDLRVGWHEARFERRSHVGTTSRAASSELFVPHILAENRCGGDMSGGGIMRQRRLGISCLGRTSKPSAHWEHQVRSRSYPGDPKPQQSLESCHQLHRTNIRPLRRNPPSTLLLSAPLPSPPRVARLQSSPRLHPNHPCKRLQSLLNHRPRPRRTSLKPTLNPSEASRRAWRSTTWKCCTGLRALAQRCFETSPSTAAQRSGCVAT